MLVTLLGIVTEVKLVQPLKALVSMLVTPSGITKFVTSTLFTYRCLAQYNGLQLKLIKAILHHAAISVIFTEVKPVHPRKAYNPMLVTLLGIVTEVKLDMF